MMRSTLAFSVVSIVLALIAHLFTHSAEAASLPSRQLIDSVNDPILFAANFDSPARSRRSLAGGRWGLRPGKRSSPDIVKSDVETPAMDELANAVVDHIEQRLRRNLASGRWGLRPGKRSVAAGRWGLRPGKRSVEPSPSDYYVMLPEL